MLFDHPRHVDKHIGLCKDDRLLLIFVKSLIKAKQRDLRFQRVMPFVIFSDLVQPIKVVKNRLK